jgi:glycosyltransferase involved in cell wall biosynthesis
LPDIFKSIVKVIIDVFSFSTLRTIVKKINPDIIYTNTSVLYHGFFLAKTLGKLHVWHLREFAWSGYRQIHPVTLPGFKKFLSKSDAVICTSNAIANYYSQNESSKAAVIYNGIKMTGSLERDYSLLTKTLKFLVVGFVSEKKGQLDAIREFEKLLRLDSAIELVIVGGQDEKYMGKIQKYLDGNPILKDKINFRGYQSNVDICYKECDYLLVYSKSEAFGRVSVEAMAEGMPVIAYSSTATIEIVDADTGFLFEDCNDSLVRLQPFLRDQNNYHRLSVNAVQKARRKFSDDTYCRKVYEILKNLSLKSYGERAAIHL